uniref:Uncharacterized protein n=1 Tax=Anguilla anguilla TaxID=7936 RepID=A0A0E9WD63_ANGAN
MYQGDYYLGLDYAGTQVLDLNRARSVLEVAKTQAFEI